MKVSRRTGRDARLRLRTFIDADSRGGCRDASGKIVAEGTQGLSICAAFRFAERIAPVEMTDLHEQSHRAAGFWGAIGDQFGMLAAERFGYVAIPADRLVG